MTRSEIHRTSVPATETVPPSGAASKARTLLSSRAGAVLLPTLLLVVAAFGFRSIGLTTSFELWVDEMLYAELGASVARGSCRTCPTGRSSCTRPASSSSRPSRSTCSGSAATGWFSSTSCGGSVPSAERSPSD